MNLILIIRYIQSGPKMIQKANDELKSSNYEIAYSIFHKYLAIFAEKIKNHPKYANLSEGLKGALNKNIKDVLKIAQKIKNHLNEIYEVEYQQACGQVKQKSSGSK